MTALCLIPLMAFAAFGVDLASFYSRASYLQKSADAAALAGTVWMPNMTKSTLVACDSLKNNGIDGGDCGTADGPFEIAIGQGSTSSSLRVDVTDPNATRYFSQVISSGDQRLTRSAEAEYNLPLPLGSPLNYFGGDRSRDHAADTRQLPADRLACRLHLADPREQAVQPGTTAENRRLDGHVVNRWCLQRTSATRRCEWTAVRC